jgi:uncharacterized protein
MEAIGQVDGLMRYPVKSMRGEELATATVSHRGFVGDRIAALIDEQTGKVATAKLPHRWRRLLDFTSMIRDQDGESLAIVFPDGRSFDTTQTAAVNRALSAELGRPVRLTFARVENLMLDRAVPEAVAEAGAAADVASVELPLGMGAPAGGFFDYAPIHVIAGPSLAAIAKVALAGVPEPLRFRPNLIIRGDMAPFVENRWVGGVLHVGASVRLKVMLPTPRCAVPTLAHRDMPPDPKLTLHIGQANRVSVLDMGELACLGAYAEVLVPGEIRAGDLVRWTAIAAMP